MESCIRSVYRLYPRFPIPKMQMDNTLFWLHLGACMVFFMQCGFALLEAGGVRAKNTKNILLKVRPTCIVTCLSPPAWGYDLSFRGDASYCWKSAHAYWVKTGRLRTYRTREI